MLFLPVDYPWVICYHKAKEEIVVKATKKAVTNSNLACIKYLTRKLSVHIVTYQNHVHLCLFQ